MRKNHDPFGNPFIEVYGDITVLQELIEQAGVKTSKRHQYAFDAPTFLHFFGELKEIVAPVAGVVVAWIVQRRKGKFSIRKSDGAVVEMGGLTTKQIEALLENPEVIGLIFDETENAKIQFPDGKRNLR
jgi:hypothetical protein